MRQKKRQEKNFPGKKTSLGKEMRISFPREEKMRISFPREVFFLTFFGRFLHEKGGSGRAMCFSTKKCFS